MPDQKKHQFRIVELSVVNGDLVIRHHVTAWNEHCAD